MHQETRLNVVVVGAGIAGLACAFKLTESEAYRAGLFSLTVLEARDKPGGVIETEFQDGCLLESGPDSFITNKPYMIDLAGRLGIADRIIGTEQENRGAMIVSKGQLARLPEGFNLIAPSKIKPFWDSPIMSLPGKVRTLYEMFVPAKTDQSDESVASFMRRRFGDELLQKIVQPMIGGIYTGDVEKLSVAMAAERFVAMERDSGSIIRTLIRQAAAAKKTGTATGAALKGEVMAEQIGAAMGQAQYGVRYGLFSSFDTGIGLVVDRLMQMLEGEDIRLRTPILAMSPRSTTGGLKPWILQTDDGHLDADVVVMAIPAKRAALLLNMSAPTLAKHLSQIDAASSVVINFVCDRKDFSAKLDAFGVVVPEAEMAEHNLSVFAFSFASQKFKGRAPEGKIVIRAFLGGAKSAALLQMDDDELTARATGDMGRLLGYAPEAQPQYARVCRWPDSMPQYYVGHRDLLSKIEHGLVGTPGLMLAGASLRGVGLPDCVHSGEECAEKILSLFNDSDPVV